MQFSWWETWSPSLQSGFQRGLCKWGEAGTETSAGLNLGEGVGAWGGKQLGSMTGVILWEKRKAPKAWKYSPTVSALHTWHHSLGRGNGMSGGGGVVGGGSGEHVFIISLLRNFESKISSPGTGMLDWLSQSWSWLVAGHGNPNLSA